MNEMGLIEQVSRIINANYSNIYAIDIPGDKVYKFEFTVSNSLVIKETLSYMSFIEMAKRFVAASDLNAYFDALSINKLENERERGNSETKVKYRKLCETGEYKWFVNIINYLPFENKKMIFMMSEDISNRLTDIESENDKLETEVVDYKKKLDKENKSISDAIYLINHALENSNSNQETRQYINSVFNKVTEEHPELNKAILNKIALSSSYKKPSILIVDDSSIIRNSLKRIFSNEYEILVAKNGEEAINIITENVLSSNLNGSKENIVGMLLDLIMPESDGFEVLNFMRSNDLFSRIPVAIISGDESRETRKRVYQYEIVDMLEKPFNTENIRRRFGKIIKLYQSSNNLQNIVDVQNEELKTANDNKSLEIIINKIINNIETSKESNALKKIVRLISVTLANNYPKYNLEAKYIDKIVNTCALYNVGSIALSKDSVITSDAIKEEIEYGEILLKNYIKDEGTLLVANNIIKYSFENFNGTGYPNSISGESIPIEAQITNIAVRIYQYALSKSFNVAIKNILVTESKKYNPDLIKVVNDIKKELKEIF